MITESAQADLNEMITHRAIKLKSPQSALKLVSQIEKAIFSLEKMPERGRYLQEEQLASQDIRRLLVENYIIFYKIDDKRDRVNIIRILYARRNWADML